MALSKLLIHPIEKVYINTALFSLCVKLLISPLATGDYQLPFVNDLNQLLDIFILCCVILYIPFTLKQFSFLYIIALISGLTYCLSTIIYADNNVTRAITSHFRVYLPLLFFTMLASYFSKNIKFGIAMSKWLCLFISILLIVGLILWPHSGNRGDVWLPSYFGGVHTTAYVALSVLFILYALLVTGEISKKFMIASGFIILATISLGWGVRTVTGAGLIFIALLISTSLKIKDTTLFASFFPVAIAALFCIIILFGAAPEFDMFTSGRISMYSEKVDQLAQNASLSWLIGNGAGSDLIVTDVWWWEAKGSHSDLLTFLVEGGIIYLFLIMFVFLKFYQNFIHSNVKFIIVAFLFTTMFSNGLITRPLPAYVFYFSLALAFAYFYKESYKEDEYDQ